MQHEMDGYGECYNQYQNKKDPAEFLESRSCALEIPLDFAYQCANPRSGMIFVRRLPMRGAKGLPNGEIYH